MKIAISSMGEDIKNNVSDTFGRSPYFIIAEIKNDKIDSFEAIENTEAEKTGGAGVSVSKLVVEKGVEIVISKNIGPRALDVLKQFNVKVYSGEGTVEESLHNFINNKLKEIN